MMMCSKCRTRQASHRTLSVQGTLALCCEGHVGEGNSPADWHPRCMAAAAVLKMDEAMKYRQQPRDLTDPRHGMKSSEYRACVDCKWFARGDDGLSCTNPLYKQFDPVHGWVARSAQQARTTGQLFCGPSGKGWEEIRYVP